VSGETILVVDDNLENVQFMVDYVLRPNGYVPLVATDGHQGLQMALTGAPDLMVLDLRLPIMSGLEVLSALQERQADIPVIFMTAYGSEEDVVTCFRLGIKDYFSKPFEIQDMLDTIERVLEEKKQQDRQIAQQRELQESVKELNALYGSSVERVLNRIVEAAVAITESEEGYLLLVDRQSDELYMRSALNIGERFARGFRLRIEDSIAGRVVRTGQPIRYNYLDDLDRFKVKTGYLVKALMNLPLRSKDGKVIGVLGVNNRQSPRVFSREDLDLLASLADHAATAIENANLYEQTHRVLLQQVQELSVMQEIARDLNGVLDVGRIGNLVLHYAMRMVGAEGGLVGLRADGEAHWTSYGYIHQAIQNKVWIPRWDVGPIGRGVRTGLPVMVNDIAASAERVGAPPQTRSQVVVPIVRGGQVAGVIDLESPRVNAFAENHQRFLLALADHAALALENTRLFDVVIGEQRKTRFILSSIADGVYTVDSDLNILTFNPAAERITGWREAEVRGKLCSTVFRDAGNGEPSHHTVLIHQVLETDEPASSRMDAPAILSRDGREVFISSSVSPLRTREGRIVGAVVAFRDVSAERELDRMKSDFVSMVSHELRSPLANLSAAIELVSSSCRGQAVLETTMQIAQANTQRLTSLIEDILSVSQIESGQMKVRHEPVTLLPVIRRTIRLNQARASRRRISIKAPDPVPFVMADQDKLEIVLNNLLINAINYSDDGSRILVRIGKPANDELVVSVIDGGIGIPEEHLPKVFERFYRVDTSDGRKVYGYGLGLYISKHLVELQGGRIWVESQVGQGSCFSFTLPIVPDSEVTGEGHLVSTIEG
jgi:PAS domain S-box-containing protein